MGEADSILGTALFAASEANARSERHEEALRKIVQWADAYPVAVFHEPTPDEWALAALALKNTGLTLDAFSASILRETLAEAGRIAREALDG